MVFRRSLFLENPSKWLALFVSLPLLGILVGCGEDAPPYAVLPLRDALRAAPEVIATLPHASRRDIAERLQDAERLDPETVVFAPEDLRLESLVNAADAAREVAGKDAPVLGEILATEGHGLFETQNVPESDMVMAPPLVLQGQPDEQVAPFEEAALRGRAGQTLRGFVARAHAKSVVRMTGLPVAAVAWNDKVFVNEAWLVAMSALEDACVVATVPDTSINGVLPPPKTPLSVDFSPYELPGTLAQCSAQVQKTCSCANTKSCTHEPTDQTFSDANAECTWASQQTANSSALCILALLSLDTVKACVEAASPGCSFMPVSDRAGGVLFATDEKCVAILDACLVDGDANNTTATPSSSSSGSGTCDDCRYCDNQGDDCQQCASDTQTCAQACEACIDILSFCASNASPKSAVGHESAYKFAAAHPVTQCSVRPSSGKSPLPTPVGTALWLFAPVAYLISRSRRRW